MSETATALIDQIEVNYAENKTSIKITLPCGCELTVLPQVNNQFGQPSQFRFTCKEHFQW